MLRAGPLRRGDNADMRKVVKSIVDHEGQFPLPSDLPQTTRLGRCLQLAICLWSADQRKVAISGDLQNRLVEWGEFASSRVLLASL